MQTGLHYPEFSLGIIFLRKKKHKLEKRCEGADKGKVFQHMQSIKLIAHGRKIETGYWWVGWGEVKRGNVHTAYTITLFIEPYSHLGTTRHYAILMEKNLGW